MHNKTILALFLFLTVLSTLPGFAQEIQTPLDSAGTVEIIDQQLEQKLELFPEYANFREARLYQVSDTSFVLEIFYQPKDRLYKIRVPLSLERTEEFKQKVTQLLTQKAHQPMLDQEGRIWLLVGSLELSLGYYGWAVPMVLDISDSKTAVTLYLFTSASGFFIPYLVTKNVPVTKGDEALCMYGGKRGIGHGMLLHLLVNGSNYSSCGFIASGMVFSIGEAIAGYMIAEKYNLSEGTVSIISVCGDFGLANGGGAAYLADFSGDNQERPVAGMILLGTGAGLLAGKLLSDHQHYTKGDAYVAAAGGVLGAYIPIATLASFHVEDNGNAYVASAMAGSMLGIGLGHYLTKNEDFTAAQGTLVSLGEFVGWLFGLGIAYLVTPAETDNNITAYCILSTVGAGAGYLGMWSVFARRPHKPETNSSWKVDLDPQGLASALNKSLLPASQPPAPMLRVEYKF
jgi:hypothetical protein